VFGPEHPDTLNFKGNLAFAVARQGRYPEAEQLYEEMRAIQQRSLDRKTLTRQGPLITWLVWPRSRAIANGRYRC
jgi:hypothetical protein